MINSTSIFIITNFLLTVALCETREEAEDRISGVHSRAVINSHSDLVSKEKQANIIYNASEKLGFFEYERGRSSPKSIVSALVSAITESPTYDNILILQIYCFPESSLFPLYMKDAEIRWSIKSTDSKKVQGSVISNFKGIVKIRLTTAESINGKTLNIKILNSTKDLVLGRGPYEFFLTENECIVKK